MFHLMLAAAVAQPTAPPPPPTPVPASAAPSATPPSATPPSGMPPSAPPSQLTASPASVDLHPAQNATFAVAGAVGDITATSDVHIAAIGVAGNVVTVAAQNRTGSDVIHVRDAAGQQIDVPLRVLFDAGTVPQSVMLRVTGDLDPAWLAQQATAAVARMARPAAGATVSVGAASAQAQGAGLSGGFSVPVAFDGRGQYFNVQGSAAVNVVQVPTEPFAPPVLYYDDDPEHVSQDGVLFRATIPAATPSRIYYYHDVAGGGPRRFVVMLTTAGGAASQVQLTDSTAGPNIDSMGVGHAVTRNFLLMKPRNEGIIVDLADGTPFSVHDLAAQSRQLVAGNVDVRVLQGAPVTVTVLSVSPGVDPVQLLGGPLVPGDGHHRSGVFDVSGFGFTNASFTAGGSNAAVVYGAREFSPPHAGESPTPGADYGDYGVWRTVAFTLSNPGDAASNAYLYFRPLGGAVRSSFLIDGELHELGCVRVASPYQLAAYALTPHSTSRVVVQTMTDGGSSYPAELGMTATPPTPSPPPVSAPDGCFPKPQPSAVASPTPAPGETPP